MSALIAVVSAVTATPVPTPTPEVITKVVTVVPDWIKQTATLGLFLVPGYFASFLHSLANAKIGLTRWANALVLFGYSIILGLLGLVAAGQFDLTSVSFRNPEQVGTAIAAVLAAAAARYAVLKAKESSDTPAEPNL